MKDTPAKNVKNLLLGENQQLQSILEKVKELEFVQKQLSRYLEPTLMKYCQVANINQNCLVIVVANGSVATQLRFMTYDLLQKFKNDPVLKQIKQIQCKVRMHIRKAASPNKTPREVTPLTPQTAAIIRDMAEGIDDPELKAILTRIASHTDK